MKLSYKQLVDIPLIRPTQGLELKRFIGNIESLKATLDYFLWKQALVCLSPERQTRCDSPARRIFWQDGMEYYPCCDVHFPIFEQWTGHTKFFPHRARFNLFRERISNEDLQIGDKTDEYNRADAV